MQNGRARTRTGVTMHSYSAILPFQIHMHWKDFQLECSIAFCESSAYFIAYFNVVISAFLYVNTNLDLASCNASLVLLVCKSSHFEAEKDPCIWFLRWLQPHNTRHLKNEIIQKVHCHTSPLEKSCLHWLSYLMMVNLLQQKTKPAVVIQLDWAPGCWLKHIATIKPKIFCQLLFLELFLELGCLLSSWRLP